jgi:hypothetical protein
MAGISFGEKAESDWMVAGWAFRQVLDDLERYITWDSRLTAQLSEARHIGFLSVSGLHCDLQILARNALRSMCADIIEGRYSSSVESVHSDSETQKLYAESIRMLLSAIENADREEHRAS